MTVKVYSTASCPWCTKAKDYLKSKNIEFDAFDVSSDRAAAKEMIDKSGQQGVPVLDIDGTIVVGFNQPMIDKLLGI